LIISICKSANVVLASCDTLICGVIIIHGKMQDNYCVMHVRCYTNDSPQGESTYIQE